MVLAHSLTCAAIDLLHTSLQHSNISDGSGMECGENFTMFSTPLYTSSGLDQGLVLVPGGQTDTTEHPDSRGPLDPRGTHEEEAWSK